MLLKGEGNSPMRGWVGGRLKSRQTKCLAQGRSSELGLTSVQPEKEEFQGPPELGVDTQIHPITCRTLS